MAGDGLEYYVLFSMFYLLQCIFTSAVAHALHMNKLMPPA